MENEKPAIRTETKYQVNSCYFCNEFLDNDDFKVNLHKNRLTHLLRLAICLLDDFFSYFI